MKYVKIKYRQLAYHTSFTVCSGDIKNSSEKKSSENDQLNFQSFLFFPLTLNLKKIPVNQLIKKFWHKSCIQGGTDSILV